MTRIVALLIGLTASAQAADFSVNDQDQRNIQGICDAAAASPTLNRDLRANIAVWCVNWEKRMEDAGKADKPAANGVPKKAD